MWEISEKTNFKYSKNSKKPSLDNRRVASFQTTTDTWQKLPPKHRLPTLNSPQKHETTKRNCNRALWIIKPHLVNRLDQKLPVVNPCKWVILNSPSLFPLSESSWPTHLRDWGGHLIIPKITHPDDSHPRHHIWRSSIHRRSSIKNPWRVRKSRKRYTNCPHTSCP